MAKRNRTAAVADGDCDVLPSSKRIRESHPDRLSRLSDELLLRILSYVSTSTLNMCQRISKKFHTIAGDSQLWKAAYYNRFVRPRASRLPGIKDSSASSDHLFYSSKLSKWLDEANLVKRGKETNWKRQYKLRHNWSRGSCDVGEIPLTEEPVVPDILVRLHEGVVYTVDSSAGLRAWSTKDDRALIASTGLREDTIGGDSPPTSLAVDTEDQDARSQKMIVGFEDGRFSVFTLLMDDKQLVHLYTHPASSNGMLSALAYASPYLLTMTGMQLMSLYKFPEQPRKKRAQEILDPPRLLYSLKSHTVWPPLSLSIRPSAQNVVASIAYALPTYFSGWSVGIQEMRITSEGKLIDSRLASATHESFHSLASRAIYSSPSTRSSSPGASSDPSSLVTSLPSYSKPTSLSYSHPYLLCSHPDNTLSLYLVTSTSSSLTIGPGSRLWGHTSSVSGAHVGGRGKAVSVSSRGDELRVWELEGGMTSSRRRQPIEDLSIRIRPENKASSEPDLDASGAFYSERSGLGTALRQSLDDLAVTKGWVGFDEENVIVLRERSEGSQALVVYDFT
ncbi:uncharacterized protein K452DRAFT_219952 [Aplosporella prunicola CBS 121167]|uniref:F-box domain-containing protein n=1 Tax=Aplosporella prunicola CBS 121167 TaxID=1176127 RepID=A0A6A6BT52_9PEZI|nr:uncharacterized protein K452DRAFT_219952 [Aplosporella prunicola CBS 121167]KAF2146007.1 hypothetical protein K452DRAFT_219952 [Aplosporella prunicola CBS 121167]